MTWPRRTFIFIDVAISKYSWKNSKILLERHTFRNCEGVFKKIVSDNLMGLFATRSS